MASRTLSYIALLILMALLCTGCVYSDTLFDGIINAKSTWLFLVTGLALAWLTVLYVRQGISFKINLLDMIIGLFFIYIIANNSFHDQQFLSKKNVENAGLLLSYIFVKRVFKTRGFNTRLFIIGLLILTFIQITAAVLQWFEYIPSYNSNYKFTGFFFNPSPFVVFLAALMVYCLAVGLYYTHKLICMAALFVFILGVPIVVISISRAAWLGLLAGILILLILKYRLYNKISSYFKSKFIVVVGLVIILFSATSAAYYLYYLKQDSADGRVLIWKHAFKMIGDHPLSGLGQGGFHASVLKYQSLYFQTHPETISTEGRLADQISYAFNDLLQIGAEQGIIGLLLFFTVIVISINFWRIQLKRGHDKTLITAAVAAITAILISGFFSYPLVMLPVQILFYTSLAIISAKYDAGNGVAYSKGGVKWGVAIACFIAGVFYINYGISTYKAYKLAYIMKESGYKQAPIHALKEYSNLLQQEPWFTLLLADELIKQGKYEQAIVQLEQAKKLSSDRRIYHGLANLYIYKKKYIQAESQYKFLSYALPQLLMPKYLLAKLYYTTHQTVLWQKQAKAVIGFRPKIKSSLTDDMQIEIQQMLLKE